MYINNSLCLLLFFELLFVRKLKNLNTEARERAVKRKGYLLRLENYPYDQYSLSTWKYFAAPSRAAETNAILFKVSADLRQLVRLDKTFIILLSTFNNFKDVNTVQSLNTES